MLLSILLFSRYVGCLEDSLRLCYRQGFCSWLAALQLINSLNSGPMEGYIGSV